jgi:hypothetical protein
MAGGVEMTEGSDRERMEIGLRLLDEAIAKWEDPEFVRRMRECRDALAGFEGAEWALDHLKDGDTIESAGPRFEAVLRWIFGARGPEGWAG